MAAQAAAAGAAFEKDIHHDPKQKPQKVCVLGGGNFGTAMAFLAASKSHSVRWYCRDPKQASTINTTRRNPRYLSDIELPEGLQATADVAEALEGATLVISALPAQATPHFIENIEETSPPTPFFAAPPRVCTSRGLLFVGERVLRAFQRPQTLAFLSGPSFARQICERHPTALVCASAKLADAVQVQFALSSKRFRVYASQDTVGVELGGALKNPLAIGAGMIEGAGLWD